MVLYLQRLVFRYYNINLLQSTYKCNLKYCIVENFGDVKTPTNSVSSSDILKVLLSNFYKNYSWVTQLLWHLFTIVAIRMY